MIKIKTGFLLFVFTVVILNTFGQQSKYNKIQTQKIAFFTEKLDLSEDEAAEFWPIYNDYQHRKNKIVQERNNLIRYYSQNSQNMTNSEIKESLDKYIRLQKDETVLLQTYNERFKSILPEEKVLNIYITELQFRNYLLKQLKESKPSAQPRK